MTVLGGLNKTVKLLRIRMEWYEDESIPLQWLFNGKILYFQSVPKQRLLKLDYFKSLLEVPNLKYPIQLETNSFLFHLKDTAEFYITFSKSEESQTDFFIKVVNKLFWPNPIKEFSYRKYALQLALSSMLHYFGNSEDKEKDVALWFTKNVDIQLNQGVCIKLSPKGFQ